MLTWNTCHLQCMIAGSWETQRLFIDLPALIQKLHAHNMFCTYIVLNVKTETKNIIFWVSWCKDTSFWKIFTCTFLFTIFLWRYQIEHTTKKGWKLKNLTLENSNCMKIYDAASEKIWPHYGMAGLSWVSSTESYSHHGPETRTSSLALSLSWFSGCIAIYYRVDQH